MFPVAKRWARLGRRNPRELHHTPYGGLCLSVFVVATQGKGILFGKVRATKDWPKRGGYPHYRAVELEREGTWLLPATHLMMEESPDHAANRIVREWAGLSGKPRFVMVQSHLRPLKILRGHGKGNHWDVCFVYELKAGGVPKTRHWWSEMQYISPAEVRKLRVGRGHLDILKEANFT